MRKKYFILLFVLSAGLCAAIIQGCSKDAPDPVNPFSSINYTITTNNEIPLDPNTIEGIHKNIISVKCANPGCHDGTFEPDYRTVQSTYSTLVYKTPVKKTLDNVKMFKYRVIPYDLSNSWIHERLTTTTSEYMPSNGVRLPQSDIDHINNWIMNGAKDMNGNIPTGPNIMPNVLGFAAFNSNFKYEFDTARVGKIFYNPFKLKHDSIVNMIFAVDDDTTQIKNLKVNEVRMSLNKDDFSSPVKTYICKYIEVPDKNNNNKILKLWYATFSSKDFSINSTVYFRYYCNDITHTQNAEFPRNESLFYYKTIYAFTVFP